MVEERSRRSPESGSVVGQGGHAGRTPANVPLKVA